MNRRTALILGSSALVSLAAPISAFAESMTPEIVDFAIGAEDAPVTIIEYASFTCPHCARFHDDVYPLLKADYVETGKVRFVYREVYFDRPGLWAAMVARCGGEMRYFGISDMLFDKQKEWIGDGTGAVIAANLRKIGLSAGLTNEELDQCMADGAKAQAMLDHYEVNITEYPIEGTPALVVNGKLYGNMGYDELKELIEKAL
ncbi:DsbA family protein [Actibacterium sp.]|uniref:DsbA family protein n=1 Tax=Actibacterium sp. TaxID=1872125 RepID=UPI00356899C3